MTQGKKRKEGPLKEQERKNGRIKKNREGKSTPFVENF